MTDKGVLSEKDLLEKAAALKRFEYSLLGKELKKQTGVAEKQYWSFSKVFKDDEEEKPVTIKKEELEIICKPKLIYNNKYSFSEYRNVGKYMDDSFESKYNRLTKFYDWLNEF